MSQSSPSSLDLPVEVFARGFCFTRSLIHPYILHRVGPVWVTRDAPRTSGDYRNEEWIGHGVAPAELDRLARRHAKGRYAISAIHGIDESDQPLREGFKRLGYRLRTSEPLMSYRLAPGRPIRRFTCPADIQRITTPSLADKLNKAARSRQILPQYLHDDAPMRQYVALIDDQPAGWVRSIVVGDATWCSNMYVVPRFRRQGIARAMLSRLLRDDRAHGSRLAVLTASHAGAKLYLAVGYEQVGTLLLFTPPRQRRLIITMAVMAKKTGGGAV